MFIEKMKQRNPLLLETGFLLHQSGQIQPDTYIIDVDTLEENARLELEVANKLHIELYFMLKQVGRNPYIAKRLMQMGYKGAVVVDWREAEIMMKHQIPIANVGHLVQPPFHLLQKLVDYGCQNYTVFTLQKIIDLNECAKKSNRVIDLLLRVVGDDDMIYSGQTAGFRLNELPNLIEKISELSHVRIKGVTSFPCFLYDEKAKKILPTANFETLMKAKQILKEANIELSNINAPSTTSVATLKAMEGLGVTSAEPGHGLTGTTPMHAAMDCAEKPCVIYVSEISHNFDHCAYCFGGGHYRRSHVENALVGHSLENAASVKITPPTPESIDYHFEINQPCNVNETVIMAFRFQMFVTRSQVCLVKGIQKEKPEIVGIYTSQGEVIA